MVKLVHDISSLSDNAALFDKLRTAADLQSLASSPSEPSNSIRSALLLTYRNAVVRAMQSQDYSELDQLIGQHDLKIRVIVLGELILTAYALRLRGVQPPEGKDANQQLAQLLDRAFRLARELAKAVEAAPPQDADDEELLIHGIALREWAHLLADYYRADGRDKHVAEMLLVRARATNKTLSSWPHLVGPAMVEAALALEAIGQVKMAMNCFQGVRMDLGYLVDRVDDPRLPRFEKIVALYWLQRACEEFCRLAPDDANAAQQLQRVRQARAERGHPVAESSPRFGPIAKTYLTGTPYLALIVRDLSKGESEASVAHRYGCYSRDVEFYVSAMGSYVVRDTILRGVSANYDEAHQEVFAAMDFLKREDGKNAT